MGTEPGRERGLGNRYFLALCTSVAAVFAVAGQLVYRGARDLADKADEQFASELASARSALERNVYAVVDELEILSSQPVMIRILDLDADSEISFALRSSTRTSKHLTEIDCYDTDGLLVASTIPNRVGKRHPEVLESAAGALQSSRASIHRDEHGLQFTVPIDWNFDRSERIGFLRTTVAEEALLPSVAMEWFALVDGHGTVVAERGTRPPEFGSELGHAEASRGMALRSTELRLTDDLDVEHLAIWVAKPYNTLFGRSLALKSKVVWVWSGSALVLGLVMFTLLRMERRYARGVLRHATELELKNAELHSSESELRGQTRIAQEASLAKSQFLATMSHELRTPMNAIIGMNGLLMDGPLNREQASLARIVQGSADSLLALINDILDFSKIEAGRMSFEEVLCDLKAATEHATAMVACSARDKGLGIRSKIEADVPHLVLTDPGKLRQVLLNLLSNAIKFTERGHVGLTIANDGLFGSMYQIRFVVEDTGIGVAEADHELLFESFSQLDASHARRFGGTGLGLAISKQVIECMGGSIGVESEPGRGSRFWFTLPMTEVPTARGSAYGEQSSASHGVPAESCGTPEPLHAPAPAQPGVASRRILIAEDNHENREYAERLVQSLGYQSDCASNGREALEAARAVQYALILMDTQMPEVDGLSAIRELRSDEQGTGRHVPILSLTANALPEDRELCLAAGADAYLPKPVPPDELREAIRDVLRRSEACPQSRAPAEASPEATDDQQARASSPSGSSPGSGADPARDPILIAEDNLVNQRLLCRLVERLGFRTELACNGLEAVEAVEAMRFALVLMDVQMPRMDGLEATRRIRVLEDGRRHTPILAVTANDSAKDRAEGLAAGMDDYLGKPVRPQHLEAAIRAWTDRQVSGESDAA